MSWELGIVVGLFVFTMIYNLVVLVIFLKWAGNNSASPPVDFMSAPGGIMSSLSDVVGGSEKPTTLLDWDHAEVPEDAGD